jgi:hypothetical protein
MFKRKQKAYVIAVDMGYGHQRAADPLRFLAPRQEIINANNYPGIPAADRKTWTGSQDFYEFISRFKKIPLVGELAFKAFDYFQEIPGFYPDRDLSDPNIQVRYMYHLIKKHHWGESLIKKLQKKPLPLITTFFVPAFMAEVFNYSEDVFVVVTDTDLSRTWVPLDPEQSKFKYFAPSARAVKRLRRYGVKEENIYLTGFPLPDELLGGENLPILKKDLAERLINLDPGQKYLRRFSESLTRHLGTRHFLDEKSDHPFTLTFAVGGAGAQRELGMKIVASLREKIMRKEIRVNLVAGTHEDIAHYFKKELLALGLEKQIGAGVKIIHCQNKEKYFRKFNQTLRQTDVLWTKPSELSFYTALGLPIIMSEAIGSQEKFNRDWLHMIGSGIDQNGVEFTDEWLDDLLATGWLAEAAMQGFLEAPKFGTYNIEKIINGEETLTDPKLEAGMDY